jgi:hypothetical protein
MLQLKLICPVVLGLGVIPARVGEGKLMTLNGTGGSTLAMPPLKSVHWYVPLPVEGSVAVVSRNVKLFRPAQ